VNAKVAKATVARKALPKRSAAKESSSKIAGTKVCHAPFIILQLLSIVADNKETVVTFSRC